MAQIKETTKKIFSYVKEHEDENITSGDVAEALGITKKSVDGSFTSFCNPSKGWAFREEDKITQPDGSKKVVKYLRLTDLGRSIDINNPPEANKSEG